jgi:hypothetical protein
LIRAGLARDEGHGTSVVHSSGDFDRDRLPVAARETRRIEVFLRPR